MTFSTTPLIHFQLIKKQRSRQTVANVCMAAEKCYEKNYLLTRQKEKIVSKMLFTFCEQDIQHGKNEKAFSLSLSHISSHTLADVVAGVVVVCGEQKVKWKSTFSCSAIFIFLYIMLYTRKIIRQAAKTILRS